MAKTGSTRPCKAIQRHDVHAPSARQWGQWGQPQPPAQSQALQQGQQRECGEDRFAAPDSWWRAACAPWSEDQGGVPSKRRSDLGCRPGAGDVLGWLPRAPRESSA